MKICGRILGALLLFQVNGIGLAQALPELKNFTLRLQGEPETLDWNKAHTPIENYLMITLMEGLVSLDSVKVEPALAESWKISGDRKTYTFKIRKNAVWSDGVPVTAEDFLTSWKRLLAPETAAAYAYFLFDIEGAEAFNQGKEKDFSKVAVKPLDSKTLQVRLRKPVSHWISIPTHWVTFPLRKDILEKYGDQWAKPGRMVTAGPYLLDRYDLNSQIILKRNPKYYGHQGKVDQITALIVADDTTALQLYQTGKLDFLTDFPILNVKSLSETPGFQIFPYLKTVYLGFSFSPNHPTDAQKWIQNPHLRKAIAMSIDRSKIGEILQGKQSPGATFVPPPLTGSSKNVGITYNPKEALEEFRLSQAPKGIELEILILNWEKTLTLAQFIQSQLKLHLGIQLNLQPYDNKTYRAQLDLHRHPLFLTSWSADYPDPDNFLSIFLSDSGNNRPGWKNSSFDHKILQARQMPSSSQRERLYIEMQRELLDKEVVIVPLYYEPNIALVNPRVRGLKLNPLNYLDIKGVEISETK
ncbi:MAG: peptide ABC transporter substrate-binding protein [Bdellovibrio sp.]|nr:peptide ABC transporter substrate-binding protein [Bdellovibrio sp.]